MKVHAELFSKNEAAFRKGLVEKRPDDYDDLVKRVVTLCEDADDYQTLDHDRITVIDHGEYQGTRVYVIASAGYQPSDYWYVRVSYGSCSGCDWFQALELPWSDDEEAALSEDTLKSIVSWATDLALRIAPMVDGS